MLLHLGLLWHCSSSYRLSFGKAESQSVCPTGHAIGATSVKRARAATGAPHVISAPHAAGLDQCLQPDAAPSVAADEVSLPQSVARCTAASTLYATSGLIPKASLHCAFWLPCYAADG